MLWHAAGGPCRPRQQAAALPAPAAQGRDRDRGLAGTHDMVTHQLRQQQRQKQQQLCCGATSYKRACN